jgi:hypothetical protein
MSHTQTAPTENNLGFDFEELRQRLGQRVHIDNARRVWEIWLDSEPFDHPAPGLTSEQNREQAFEIISGLPSWACQHYAKVCREFERELFSSFAPV